MKKKYKKYVLKTVVPIIVMTVLVIACLIHINIINTKTLSPLGNTKQNYELVSEKFGADFANFIKDNSFLKIYEDSDNKKVLVRLGDAEFKISSESEIIKYIENKINSIK
ncbi:hypothetical protein [Clostridium butyricum]|uniref:hypothetical protein n=1 Tax=Clostridium butyricum TaxID=1492 RepID=UPI0011DDFFD7|nr:hypothetical protein [Clostridium butyricum]